MEGETISIENVTRFETQAWLIKKEKKVYILTTIFGWQVVKLANHLYEIKLHISGDKSFVLIIT